MTITAIILNYKNYEDIYACVLSLQKQTLPKNYTLKILIIDNNSEDNSTKKLQEDFPQYEYIYNKENYGFSKAINQGIKLNLSNSDFFLLVNNDALLESNCLKSLIISSEGEALTGPAIFYKNKPNIIWQGGGYYSKIKMNVDMPEKNKLLEIKENRIVDFLSGCVLLIPKKIINKIGYFDENFFFYGEDLDFCLRAKNAQIRSVYCPKALSWHNIKDISVSHTSPFVLKNLALSYNLIVRKHFPHLKIYGFILFLFIYTPFRLFQIIKGGNNLKNIYAWINGGIQGWNIKI